MVQAVIWPLNESNTDSSLVLLEFQGNFTSNQDNVQGLKIGDVEFTNNGATLTTGHQKLYGDKVKLPKPIAVIRKRGDEDAMDVDQTQTNIAYDTVTILREKYVFMKRPMLIVQHTQNQQ
ncbi:chromosome transmission fidelity protein 8 [Dichotomocladium elegans]|nr:chromosome transmission fidelity protein 8 [Dichotomocladium elegans]